ncbi:MAG: hypothetical protein ACRD8O_10020 [Bryobacteraceae bacterium]
MRRERAATVGCVAALIAVNAWIIARLFRTEYTEWVSSIEGAYIGLARWIARHWTQLDWYPLWYGGVPFENTYPPLLHVVVAATAQATGMSEARAYHTVCGAMYCLGPVTLFWLTWRLSGSRWKGLLAARGTNPERLLAYARGSVE